MIVKVRTALMVGFALVIGLFGLATVVTTASMSRIDLLQSRLADLDYARHQSDWAISAIQEQYIHQAHTLLSDDLSHFGHYGNYRREVEKRLARLEAACSEIGMTGELVDIRETVVEMHRYFENNVVNDLERGFSVRERDYHIRLEALTERARILSENLSLILDHQSTEAKDELNRVVEWTQIATVGMLATAIFAAIAVGFALVRMIGKPIAGLHEAFAGIGKGRLETRMELEGPRELRELARSFNEMAAALGESRERIAEQERMVVMGELASGVAHELNNPLGVITGYLKVVRKSQRDDQVVGDLDIIADEVRQCQAIVQGLLDLARPHRLEKTKVDVAALASETVDRLDMANLGPKAKVVVSATSRPLMAFVDSSALKRVVANLLTNAYEAAGPQGEVQVTVEEDDGSVVISVSDSGDGIAPEIEESLFKPFHTTKPKGTGLGLAICDALVRGHGGRIEVGRAARGGALFRVVIPKGSSETMENGEEA